VALVERCRGGDRDAFRQLVERHSERVYRTAYALTGNAEDAGDVTQETWLKAWRGLRRFRGDSAVGTWLTRLALNAARDHLRRRQTRAALQHALRGLRRLGTDRAATGGAIEERDALARAIAHLPFAARQVVALRYGPELSVAEIAAALGCPEGTVKSRLHAALARLREVLQQEGSSGRSAPAAPQRPAGHPSGEPGAATQGPTGETTQAPTGVKR
jgi:RNA polymerase sigma-70 factor (ECF subfamily)